MKGLTVEMESEILVRPLTYRNMEVSVAEIQPGDRLSLLKGETDGLWGFHLESGWR